MACVHIYTGDGKGKTTAALGLALRMSGSGGRVLIVRFLKTEDSGELKALRQLPGVEVLPATKAFGFYFQMTDREKEEARAYYTDLFYRAKAKAKEERVDLFVLDELTAVYNYELIPRKEWMTFLRQRPEWMEIVMTGRDPAPELLEEADYVSEIHKRKHPFDRGVKARKGIEY